MNNKRQGRRGNNARNKTVIIHNNYGGNRCPSRRNSGRQMGPRYYAPRREPSKGEIAMGAFACLLGAFSLCSKAMDLGRKF